MLGCSGCQTWILRSFIASVGGTPFVNASMARQQHRSISQCPRRMNEARERIQKEEEHVLNEISDEAEQDALSGLDKTSESPPKSETVPWYLQVQQDQQQAHTQPEKPLMDRQKIPDTPEHPPTLLQPLLNHLSIEQGMDYLTLLDLRTLDPPPALGANLLMIVGTARSEKHLHISADRLCRWLRTEYKLRPYADGLLGRNELKLKMRRKAKRSRLLSSVGSKATGETDIDDGIRTGWVCVNIGRVEGGELPEQVEKVQRAEGVVGFGARAEGCSVVVQMLTEEKREELDLEKLWGDMLTRGKREQERANEAALEEAEGGEKDEDSAGLRSEEGATAANPHPLDGAGERSQAARTAS